jgi:hypothetical protein
LFFFFFFFFFFQTIVTQDWVKNNSLSSITQNWASPSQIWARRCADLWILRSWPCQDAPPPIRGLTADVKRRIPAGKSDFFWWSGFFGLSFFSSFSCSALDPLRAALRTVWRRRQDLHLSLKRLPLLLFFFFGELNGRKKKWGVLLEEKRWGLEYGRAERI